MLTSFKTVLTHPHLKFEIEALAVRAAQSIE